MHVLLGGIPIHTPVWDYGATASSPAGALPDVIVASRPALETLLRKLVRESPDCSNIEFLTGIVTGAVPSKATPNRLEGVQVRLEGQKESQIIIGELIVGTDMKPLPRDGPDLNLFL